MSRPAHPGAMAPSKPGSTRTAPPQLPNQFPFSGRYRAYTIFDWTGVLYLLLGFLALDAVWALGSGDVAWNNIHAHYANPIYIAFHAIALLGVTFVGVRFFGFFPKAQPPRIGPLKPPPQPVILGMLYLVWIGVTGLMALILAGKVFG